MRLDLIEQEAGKHGTRVEGFKVDVGRHAANKKLVDHAIARLGRLDIVVAERRRLEPRRSADREDDREAVGRDDAHQSKERVLADPLFGART